jgi:hypothetical protein
VVTTIAAGVGTINGVAIDGSGDFITNSCGGDVLSITPSGVLTIIASGGLGCLFNTPAIDGAGDIIVTDFGGTLFRVTPAGVVTTIASGPPFGTLMASSSMVAGILSFQTDRRTIFSRLSNSPKISPKVHEDSLGAEIWHIHRV